jgi:hypothetical protein
MIPDLVFEAIAVLPDDFDLGDANVVISPDTGVVAFRTDTWRQVPDSMLDLAPAHRWWSLRRFVR